MSVGLYRAAVAMVGNERRLDAIAANLANLETSGYKRMSTSTQEFTVQRRTGVVRGQKLKVQVDFSQGNLRRTEAPYDLALHGEGFFGVEGPTGEIYTRSGAFRVTEDGVITTEEGWEISWDTRAGAIDPTGDPVIIDSQGVVRQGRSELGKLRIVDFIDKSQLVPVDGGYYQAPEGLEEATVTANVHQASLEESNAKGVEEIIAMIGVQRSFESVANLIKSIQESYSRLTRPSF